MFAWGLAGGTQKVSWTWALERGDLRCAMTLADELRIEHGKPIDLETALLFLALIARDSPREFDAWALRWLVRWASETPATLEQAAEVAAQLADLPSEPAAINRIHHAAHT